MKNTLVRPRDSSPPCRLAPFCVCPARCSALLTPACPSPVQDDEKVKDKITEEDKAKATAAITEALQWLEGNQMAEKEEFDHKRKEVEGICTPIMTAMYSQGGGGDMGGMPGGMPGGAP